MAAEKIMVMGKKQSNFSVTCSLLSQYLKEKGGLGGLGLENMAPRPLDQQAIKGIGTFRTPTTMNLLPGVNVSDKEEFEDNTKLNTPKSMDLFPQHTGFDEEPVKTSNIMEVEKAPLTIFYGGKMLVFDDFPAEKAKDLMQMVSKEISVTGQNCSFAASSSAALAEPSSRPESIFAAISGNQPPLAMPEKGTAKSSTEAGASDMPIARRNSLHRFLEKRKDRISAKAPYQVHGVSPAPETKKAMPEDSKSWLGLGREVSGQKTVQRVLEDRTDKRKI